MIEHVILRNEKLQLLEFQKSFKFKLMKTFIVYSFCIYKKNIFNNSLYGNCNINYTEIGIISIWKDIKIFYIASVTSIPIH